MSYSSDKQGLVWAYRLQPRTAAIPLTWDEFCAWSDGTNTAPDDSFVWLHFSLSNAASERTLRRSFTLPQSFYQSLTELAASTRVEEDGETLVAIVHDVLFDPAAAPESITAAHSIHLSSQPTAQEFSFDPEAVSTVHLCLTPRLFVTARLKPVRSVDMLRADVRAGESFRSPAQLLAQLLRHQADVLTDIVRKAALQVDAVEDKLLAHRIPTSRRELGAIRRTLVRLQRLLAPEPAALFRLLGQSSPVIGGDDLNDLRQATEEFSAVIADSGTLVERVKLLQEELSALVGEQTGRTLYILTIVTVLALPVNMIAGVFGMNVGGIPFGQSRAGFFVIVTTLALFTGFAAYLALGRRRE